MGPQVKKWSFLAIFFAIVVLSIGKVFYPQVRAQEDSLILLPTSTPAPTTPTNELIVVFNNRPTTSSLLSVASQTTQATVSHGITGSNAMVYSIPQGTINETISEISANANVASVFPNYQLSPIVIPNDPLIAATPVPGRPRIQWSMFNMNLAGEGQSAWDKTTGSSSVVVAVIDSGADSSHPDLSSKFSCFADCSGASCTQTTCGQLTSMTDAHSEGHGTHVSGLVAAATNNSRGVAGSGYNTKLMAIKIMEILPDGTESISLDSFINAVGWAADHGAKVMNLSVGQIEENLDPAAIALINNVMNYAWGKGALIVAAAGNCGQFEDSDGDPSTVEPDHPCAIIDANGNPVGYGINTKIYPAASPNVLSVAALDVNNQLTGYSQRNSSTNPNWVSVAAPGGDCSSEADKYNCVASTLPDNHYGYSAGTSMAAPHVSGLAALALSLNPNLTNSQLKILIEATTNSAIAKGANATNYGAVDALKTVNAASSGGGTPPPGATNPPVATLYPTTPPRLRNTPPSPWPAGPYCPVNTSCSQKTTGDANCDGVVNASDYTIWLQQLDTMPTASNVNSNANFSCVEGNTTTYYADIVDFEIWRRNTTSGLVTPAPTIPPTPTTPAGQPTPTSSPQAGCSLPAGECVVACVSLDDGATWTSSDVTVSPGKFLHYKPEPLSGMTLYVRKVGSPNVLRQCSDTSAAGEICPIHSPLTGDYEPQARVKVFKYSGQWWQGEDNNPCSDTLTITIN